MVIRRESRGGVIVAPLQAPGSQAAGRFTQLRVIVQRSVSTRSVAAARNHEQVVERAAIDHAGNDGRAAR